MGHAGIPEGEAQMGNCLLLFSHPPLSHPPDLSPGAVPVRQAQVSGPAELPLPQCTGAVFGFERKVMNRNVLAKGVVGTVASCAAKPDWETQPGKAQQLKLLGTA